MANSNNHRVVVTGLGVVSPLGQSMELFTTNLLQGESAGDTVHIFDPANLTSKIAAQVNDYNSPVDLPDRKIGFAISAVRAAIKDANDHGQPIHDYYQSDQGRLSIGIGLELFSLPDMCHYLEHGKLVLDHTDTAKQISYLQTPSDICVHLICHEQSMHTVPLIHVSACAASTDAIGCAFKMIQQGRSQWMLAGGTDSMINPLGMGGFCKLRALTEKNQEPKKASKPFDRKRDGFLLGEGAGFVVLENKQHAKARQARIYAEICGYGNSFDAHGISEPHPEGAGAILAIEKSIKDAQISHRDIVYINAHGTSTPKNDLIETQVIKKIFGHRAYEIPVSATKSMIGHLISAAGAVEVCAMLGCAQKGYLHPTINLDFPDPQCDLNYLANGKQPASNGYYLKNSFGFGGQNAALIFHLGEDP